MSDSAQPSESVIRRRGVVAVVVREGRYLVIRRAAGVVAPGTYCFPGGGIEEDETETIALAREMREELGIEVRPLKCISRSTTSWGTALAWWLSEFDEALELLPNADEVESIHWLSPDEMLELTELLESNRLFLEAVARGEIELA
jgi:(d)CTP diphosphatase